MNHETVPHQAAPRVSPMAGYPLVTAPSTLPPANADLRLSVKYHQLVVTVSNLSASTDPATTFAELIVAHGLLLSAMSTLAGRASFYYSAVGYRERGFLLLPPTPLEAVLSSPRSFRFPPPCGVARIEAGLVHALDALALFKQRQGHEKYGAKKALVVLHTTGFEFPSNSARISDPANALKRHAVLFIADHRIANDGSKVLSPLATSPRHYATARPGSSQLERLFENLGHALATHLGDDLETGCQYLCGNF